MTEEERKARRDSYIGTPAPQPAVSPEDPQTPRDKRREQYVGPSQPQRTEPQAPTPTTAQTVVQGLVSEGDKLRAGFIQGAETNPSWFQNPLNYLSIWPSAKPGPLAASDPSVHWGPNPLPDLEYQKKYGSEPTAKVGELAGDIVKHAPDIVASRLFAARLVSQYGMPQWLADSLANSYQGWSTTHPGASVPEQVLAATFGGLTKPAGDLISYAGNKLLYPLTLMGQHWWAPFHLPAWATNAAGKTVAQLGGTPAGEYGPDATNSLVNSLFPNGQMLPPNP